MGPRVCRTITVVTSNRDISTEDHSQKNLIFKSLFCFRARTRTW